MSLTTQRNARRALRLQLALGMGATLALLLALAAIAWSLFIGASARQIEESREPGWLIPHLTTEQCGPPMKELC